MPGSRFPKTEIIYCHSSCLLQTLSCLLRRVRHWGLTPGPTDAACRLSNRATALPLHHHSFPNVLACPRIHYGAHNIKELTPTKSTQPTMIWLSLPKFRLLCQCYLTFPNVQITGTFSKSLNLCKDDIMLTLFFP